MYESDMSMEQQEALVMWMGGEWAKANTGWERWRRIGAISIMLNIVLLWSMW